MEPDADPSLDERADDMTQPIEDAPHAAERASSLGGFEFPPPPTEVDAAVDADAPVQSAVDWPLVFPPMSNPHIVGLASATLVEEDVLRELVPSVDAPLDDRARALLADALAGATTQVNDSYFRFHLTHIHEDDQPELRRFESGAEILGLDAARSNRKLTLVLVLPPHDGVEDVSARLPTVDKALEVTTGTLVVAPAYLPLVFTRSSGGPIDAILSHALGPAFA